MAMGPMPVAAAPVQQRDAFEHLLKTVAQPRYQWAFAATMLGRNR